MLAGTIEEAFEVHGNLPGSLLVGEAGGAPLPGFHFGNSPVEVSREAVAGKTLIQRTTCGTQGVVRSKNADRILTSSFVVAQATLERIQQIAPETVSFIVTSADSVEEDLALADYLESLLLGRDTNPRDYIERVLQSPSGLIFASGRIPHLPKNDLEAVCRLDCFPFALEVFMEEGLRVLRPVDAQQFPLKVPLTVPCRALQ